MGESVLDSIMGSKTTASEGGTRPPTPEVNGGDSEAKENTPQASGPEKPEASEQPAGDSEAKPKRGWPKGKKKTAKKKSARKKAPPKIKLESGGILSVLATELSEIDAAAEHAAEKESLRISLKLAKSRAAQLKKFSKSVEAALAEAEKEVVKLEEKLNGKDD